MDIITKNKKATFDFEIIDRYEAGMVLRGTEVKSIREKKIILTGAFARIMDNEIYLLGMQIQHYPQAYRNNHDPDRTRKLLLNKQEIRKIRIATEQRGITLVATCMYWKNGYVKVEIATGKGKKSHDKREAIKKRETKISLARLSR